MFSSAPGINARGRREHLRALPRDQKKIWQQRGIAVTTLAKLIPERKVIEIHAVALVLGLGTLHHLTQPQVASELY